MAASLRPRKTVNYKDMHEGQCFPSERTLKNNKTVVLEQDYYIERVIWRKRIDSAPALRYLVKWEGYHESESTWEPADHIPSHVISAYKSPSVQQHRIDTFAGAIEKAVEARLKSKNPSSVIYVDLDVFRACFGDTERLCNLEDFKTLDLPKHWYYRLGKDGTGVKLKFPVRLTPKLLMRNLYVKDGNGVTMRMVPSERCLMYSCIEACSHDQLN